MSVTHRRNNNLPLQLEQISSFLVSKYRKNVNSTTTRIRHGTQTRTFLRISCLETSMICCLVFAMQIIVAPVRDNRFCVILISVG